MHPTQLMQPELHKNPNYYNKSSRPTLQLKAKSVFFLLFQKVLKLAELNCQFTSSKISQECSTKDNGNLVDSMEREA
jgi:hypothetical protein